jgi:hypothetical protein
MRTTGSRRTFVSLQLKRFVLAIAAILTVFGSWSATGAAPASAAFAQATAGARPDFRLPFACGETWQLQTYEGHAPDDKKLDMYRVGGQTLGAQVVASAAGTVTELFEPGGLEINHGGGWWFFSVYLHVTPPTRKRGGFSLCRVGVATDQPGP